jgi:DNA-binding CsgD family transcriptional regulator
MDRSKFERELPLFVIVLGLFVSGGLIDLFVLDQPVEWWSFHVIFESTVLLIGLGLLVILARGRLLARQTIRDLSAEVAEYEADRERWRSGSRVALQSMAVAIDRQFDDWQLTPAEREVALALLKGYSHKAIAARTERSAQTVRSHAAAVYAKAGLSGRAQLSAFFLEDIDLPSRASANAAIP